jgi:hypothetical protein
VKNKIETKERTNLDFCQHTIALKENIERTFIELGRRLFKIREERLYEPFYDSFNVYCDELKLSQSTISKLVNIYKKFILEYGFTAKQLMKAGGWGVMAEALPVIKSKADARDFLEKAETLTLRDMRKEVLEKKTGMDQRTCKHKDDFYVLQICRVCGDRQTLEDSRHDKQL